MAAPRDFPWALPLGNTSEPSENPVRPSSFTRINPDWPLVVVGLASLPSVGCGGAVSGDRWGPEGGAGNYTGHNSLWPGLGPGGFCAGDWWSDTTGGQWWGTSVLTMVQHSALWCAVSAEW